MACCKCCCGGVDCAEGDQGKCCCGGSSGTCCQSGEYCCSGVCQAGPCTGDCLPPSTEGGCNGVTASDGWLLQCLSDRISLSKNAGSGDGSLFYSVQLFCGPNGYPPSPGVVVCSYTIPGVFCPFGNCAGRCSWQMTATVQYGPDGLPSGATVVIGDFVRCENTNNIPVEQCGACCETPPGASITFSYPENPLP